MKPKLSLAAATLAGVMTTTAAMAHPGVTGTSVNMRLGPGTEHDVLATIPPNQTVTIVGCLSASAWCDVVWAGYRGWVSASYIYSAATQQAVPIVTVYDRVPTVSPWVEARRDARVQYRVNRRMDRRWDRWTSD